MAKRYVYLVWVRDEHSYQFDNPAGVRFVYASLAKALQACQNQANELGCTEHADYGDGSQFWHTPTRHPREPFRHSVGLDRRRIDEVVW